MQADSITIDVMIDGKSFRKFAAFDNLYLRRRWISPAIFAGIFLLFACICFATQASHTQAVLLGCVLSVIGLGFPSVYLLTFFNSVKLQIKKYKMTNPRLVYSLTLSGEPDGIQVRNEGGEHATYKWDSLYGAYRVKECTYLYVASIKAFLLPDEQIEGGAESLWELLTKVLPSEKLHDCRLKK